jgi:hypothetical protein
MKHILPLFALAALVTGSCMTGIPAASPTTPTGVAAVPIAGDARTPLPLARWVAQDIPADTLVTCKTVRTPFRGEYGSVTISADGTVTGVIYDAVLDDPIAEGVGRISQAELRQVLLEFANADFFAVETVTEHGETCAYYPQDLVDPGNHPYPETDAPSVEISISVGGVSKSVYAYLGCGRADLWDIHRMMIGIGMRILQADEGMQPVPTEMDAAETATS